MIVPLLFALAVLPGVRSPSGNITCYVANGPTLHCNVKQASYGPKLTQQCSSRTGLDWRGFDLTAKRRATVSCSGGVLYNPATQRPRYTTLPYGQSWHSGPFTCVATALRFTCTSRSGHGLWLSLSEYHLS